MVIGATKISRTLYSYCINQGKLEAYDEPWQLKKSGVIKSLAMAQDGFLCLGGDHHIPYVKINALNSVREDTAQQAKPADVNAVESSPKAKKNLGALSVGMMRKKATRKFL